MRRASRLTIAIATVSAPLFAGCFAVDHDPRKPLAAHDQKCEQLGFKRGTPDHSNCRVEQARETTPLGATPAPSD
jgi:hypothetical protein